MVNSTIYPLLSYHHEHCITFWYIYFLRYIDLDAMYQRGICRREVCRISNKDQDQSHRDLLNLRDLFNLKGTLESKRNS
jgi:hypothetical protein